MIFGYIKLDKRVDKSRRNLKETSKIQQKKRDTQTRKEKSLNNVEESKSRWQIFREKRGMFDLNEDPESKILYKNIEEVCDKIKAIRKLKDSMNKGKEGLFDEEENFRALKYKPFKYLDRKTFLPRSNSQETDSDGQNDIDKMGNENNLVKNAMCNDDLKFIGNASSSIDVLKENSIANNKTDEIKELFYPKYSNKSTREVSIQTNNIQDDSNLKKTAYLESCSRTLTDSSKSFVKSIGKSDYLKRDKFLKSIIESKLDYYIKITRL